MRCSDRASNRLRTMFRTLLLPLPDVPSAPNPPMSARRLPHWLSSILGLASIMLFWRPLQQLLSLSLNDQRYTHIILVPVISAVVMYLERRRIFSRTAFCPRVGLPFLAASLAMYGLVALRVVQVPTNYTLSTVMLPIILVWLAGFTVCYGVHAFKAAVFPLLFLLLLVPIPFDLMDKIVFILQRGSAETTYVLFKLAGIPMFRDGVRFELPGLGVEIAEECSSIHSAWALFITGLLVAHMFLKFIRTKICLSVLTLPIAVFTNAVRIVTLWFLGTRVDPKFMFGDLHHRGGVLFSLISLSILTGFVCILRKIERGWRPSITA